MNVLHAAVVLLLALWSTAACAAERGIGIFTIVDGDARVLRKTTWYRLEAGAHAEPGDVLDVSEHAQVQIELPRGTAISAPGPALAYLPEARADAKTSPPFMLMRGWIKAANAAKAPPLRLDLPTSALRVDDGIVVVHCDAMHTEFFVESGRASLLTPAPRGKEQARDAAEGEYWHRTGDRAFETDDRPSQAFIAAMPRALRDRLPALASHFEGTPPALPAGREITFVEAEPWLSGPARRTFARRFAARLSDPAFRSAAAAHNVPEWDRTLHPERYKPRDADPAASPQPFLKRQP
ncbi:MAG TPA: hypothetical protein VN858_00895 [Casimicrobiaceae bacterium]|nr:hypothetical protein [Casimicrobiaceae bacterium]